MLGSDFQASKEPTELMETQGKNRTVGMRGFSRANKFDMAGMFCPMKYSTVLAMGIFGFGFALFAQQPSYFGTRDPSSSPVNAAPIADKQTVNNNQPPRFFAACPVTGGKFAVSIASGNNGIVWVGTEEEGVYRFDPNAPADQRWAQFTTEQGLGDNNAYAITCDKAGRTWVGTVNHGVSVFNGREWRTYDQTTGPLGERVFAMACCPTDGDVWIGTNIGLARYSPVKDGWRYYTRLNGVPSEQIQAVAFDKSGQVYIGTQCDGVATAEPKDDYASWKTSRAPSSTILTPTGNGLPSDQINGVLAASDGTIYVATSSGLAKSTTHGQGWTYVRGADFGAKIKGMTKVPDMGLNDVSPRSGQNLLPEDYITSLGEGTGGIVWLGFRTKGIAALDPKDNRLLYRDERAGDFVKAIKQLSDTQVALATYGGGYVAKTLTVNADAPSSALRPKIASGHTALTPVLAVFPSPAAPKSEADLNAMLDYVKKLPPTTAASAAAFLGDDWSTKGDWVGRYGRQQAILCAMAAPMDHNAAWGPWVTVTHTLGSHHHNPDAIRHYCHWRQTDQLRCLYTQISGCRREAEWDDHGEDYPATWEGPDIWVSVEVPDGVFRLSFYFVNPDGHEGTQRNRDFLLELKSFPKNLQQDIKPNSEDVRQAEATPTLAQARVTDFWHGVYKQFIVKGKGHYLLRISRNYSFNTIVSAVLVDQLQGTVYKDPETCWIPFMGDAKDNVFYCRPDIQPSQQATSTGSAVAKILCDNLDPTYAIPATWRIQKLYRLLAYRTALHSGGSEDLLANMRWKSFLWTDKDKSDFTTTMLLAWQKEEKRRRVTR